MDESNHDEKSDNKNLFHYKELKRIIQNERFSPELLPFSELIFQEVIPTLAKLRLSGVQIKDQQTTGISWLKQICQFEYDRVKYLVSSYCRIRLEKIDIFGKNIDESLLVEQEIQYWKKIVSMEEQAFRQVLKDDFEEFVEDKFEEFVQQSRKPELSKILFCRSFESEILREDDQVITMEPGSVYILKYSTIRKLLLDGKVELC